MGADAWLLPWRPGLPIPGLQSLPRRSYQGTMSTSDPPECGASNARCHSTAPPHRRGAHAASSAERVRICHACCCETCAAPEGMYRSPRASAGPHALGLAQRLPSLVAADDHLARPQRAPEGPPPPPSVAGALRRLRQLAVRVAAHLAAQLHQHRLHRVLSPPVAERAEARGQHVALRASTQARRAAARVSKAPHGPRRRSKRA